MDIRRPDIVSTTLADGEEPRGTPTRVLVVVPVRSSRRGEGADAPSRSATAKRDEAVGLAAAIDLEVTEAVIVTLNEPRPATLIGKGKVEELAGLVTAHDAGLVFVDAALSPVQQRNLEKAWKAKVVDRTGLILEIFGRRARTKEGGLQVELAHLSYQKSRLVRSWTHLERQRGGFGFLGGPGETQIEADRRMIQERITRIERELEQVTRTRRLHRQSRRRVPYPIIALVGYTNAGKSTLFNALTTGGVLAQDLLFATLDPTLRQMRLPRGTKAILSDTVGFISDLPTMLVAAFRATLEEVIEADVILHVRDVSHGDTEAQAADVKAILGDLGVDQATRTIIEVWNKVDLLDPESREAARNRAERHEPEARPHFVSAITGEGLEALLSAVEDKLRAAHDRMTVTVAAADGATLHWIHENAEVEAREALDSGETRVTLRIAPAKRDQLERRLAQAS
ncbi:GTPase HflX [Phreatobacter oligotrophus]|uniref:GTPase HflX n=1 Tax=Phreatobacter oligotrophus TaxID=1122261 RepID=A0A2T4Z582_9HYPH|nr:GTPase HflX [Phreatobacter oligotrophus]PTM57052.1 GTP-binding protein HflX [Phreatobacter oligotrophus]